MEGGAPLVQGVGVVAAKGQFGAHAQARCLGLRRNAAPVMAAQPPGKM